MDVIHADIPDEYKHARACLRCTLVKTFEQFYENGCENCDFLDMHANSARILQCTTSYFEGNVALIDPGGSWVAKWQRIVDFIPGIYAIDVTGDLPDEILDLCEQKGRAVRPKLNKN
ncbi:unnamed protein product [Ectocarpus fasciculatus]